MTEDTWRCFEVGTRQIAPEDVPWLDDEEDYEEVVRYATECLATQYFEQAYHQFSEATDMEPTPRLWLGFGLAASANGSSDQEIEIGLEKALAMEITDVDVLVDLACLASLHRFKDLGRQALERAKSIAPGDPALPRLSRKLA